MAWGQAHLAKDGELPPNVECTDLRSKWHLVPAYGCLGQRTLVREKKHSCYDFFIDAARLIEVCASRLQAGRGLAGYHHDVLYVYLKTPNVRGQFFESRNEGRSSDS